jgi:hypothetical protein
LIGPFDVRQRYILTYETGTGRKRSPQELLDDIQGLIPGDVAVGHLHATPDNIQALCGPNIVNYFIHRDPRDVVVSHAFYVTYIASHNVNHQYYSEVLNNMKERITTSIMGRTDTPFEFPNIRARVEPFLPWLEVTTVMPIRFEDLIRDRDKVIYHMLDHLEASGYPMSLHKREACEKLKTFINPAKSPTFREGKIGGWRKHFTDEHKLLFKDVAGDLLIQLGYEESLDW